MIASRSPGRKKRTGRGQKGSQPAKANLMYAVRGTVSFPDIEITTSAEGTVLRATQLRVWNPGQTTLIGRVDLVADPNFGNALSGTVNDGTAAPGDLVEFPDTLGAIRGLDGQGLAPGFIELV